MNRGNRVPLSPPLPHTLNPNKLRVTHLAIIDFALHTDLDQFNTYMDALISEFKRNSDYFLAVSSAYERKVSKYLSQMEKLSTLDFKGMTNNQLLAHLRKFVSGYFDIAPIISFPFAVERLNEQQYQGFLVRLSERAEANIRRLASNASIIKLFPKNPPSQGQGQQEILRALSTKLTWTPKKTFTQRKNEALLMLAVAVSKDPKVLRLFKGSVPQKEAIEKEGKQLYSKIMDVFNRYKWLKQTGYPPYYNALTIEEFLAQLSEAVKSDPAGRLKDALLQSRSAEMGYKKLVSIANPDRNELKFIETINDEVYFRTWRMEVLFRAQYLSIPLLREIEGRAKAEGRLEDDDVFFMTPPELEAYLAEGRLPPDIRERRTDWAIVSRNGEPWGLDVITGDALKSLKSEFYSVIEWRERNRGNQKPDNSFVGGKASNLFTLATNKIKVPEFFCVTTLAYEQFISLNSLNSKIASAASSPKSLNRAEERIRKLFINSNMPPYMERAILEAYNHLGCGVVSVRSSATVEDAAALSWAGRFKSFLWIDKKRLMRTVKEVWASLFASTALQYSAVNGINLTKQRMAVIVQRMVESEASGVVNTVLSSANPDIMEIEATLGQCTPLVGGETTPDRYLISKSTGKIRDKSISTQKKRYTHRGWRNTPASIWGKQKISEGAIRQLAGVCTSIENIYERPQDIEWALQNNKIYILQARPQTSLYQTAAPALKLQEPVGELILSGTRGVVSMSLKGTARMLRTPDESSKIKRNEILVTKVVTPLWDPVLFKAAAIITDEGGSTSHGIRIANERGVPAVVGTYKATSVIKDGDTVIIDTTDPFKGRVYRLA